MRTGRTELCRRAE